VNHLNQKSHEFDVCVVGGGMAGMCAAIAAARNGAKTAIVHDRPVFGGNASSEIRMWICGAHGKENKETGILEEIQLENEYRNPEGNYSVWDSVLWEKIAFQPGLTAFMNCSCTNAAMDGDRIASIQAWQLTSQTWHTIHAKLFIDCSGDSILAAVTGAEFRIGREARAEFDEDIEPKTADKKTMGNSLLIQLRRTEEAQPFVPPRWAYSFSSENDFPQRMKGVNAQNFWWMEIGGLQDTIADAENIQSELVKIAYGMWDYIKNVATERAKAENWAIEWIGSLPGKRENRRYVGDHILTQNEVRAGGEFDDIIAYGGWSMDDHHPAGLYFPGAPTIFHPAPSPYGIPYRSLYSRNIQNLFFAGRNISVTHAALSSTRVMATCSLLGQAAGTAAALCVRHRCSPRGLTEPGLLRDLQQILMNDDCWLPGRSRAISDLAGTARLSGDGDNLSLLLDGTDRDRPDESHSWTGAVGQRIEFHWPRPVHVGGVRIVFDSNLNHLKHMPCSYPRGRSGTSAALASLVKTFRIESLDADGQWRVVFRETGNYQRLVVIPLRLETRALRFVPEETWGDPEVRIHAFEPLEVCEIKAPAHPPIRPSFSDACAKIDPADLQPPDALDSPQAGRGVAA
jgi:hypothetical protein